MGLLKIISSLFHGTEKSSELFEAEIPVAQENTSHDLMAGHVEDKMAYADSSSIAPDERPFYQPDECYTFYSYPESDIGNRVVTFEDRKKTCIPSARGLYVAEILLLDYCQKGKYPKPEHGYPGFWWFEYGIRDVGHAMESLCKRGFIELTPLMQSVGSLKVSNLKNLLRKFGVSVSGKKADLVKRVQENVPEDAVAETGLTQKYRLTDLGRKELEENAYVPYMHHVPNKTTEDGPEDEQFNVWIINKKLHEEKRTDWENLVDEIEEERKRKSDEKYEASLELLKKIDSQLYKKLKAQNEQIELIRKKEEEYQEDEDALIAFWEGIWKHGGLNFEGAYWLFRLPDLYLKQGRLDEALKLCKQIKEQKKNYAYKAEDYIERIDAIKREKFEKGTKK